ncbi:unnamed protein product, partial [Urochloa humidicola]
MDLYQGSLLRYWMEKEEDDDPLILFDDDEADIATYNHLVQAEGSHTRRRRRLDAPPKVIRQRNLAATEGENRGFPEMLYSIDCMHW